MNDSTVTVKDAGNTWLLLIHQIPPKPDYFRVKVRRRLQRIGAVPLKNSVYVLPAHDQAAEDFRWLLREIEVDGGEATICEGTFIEGTAVAELEALFRAERDAEYQEIVAAAHQLERGAPRRKVDDPAADGELGRLRRRLEEIQAIDYFGAAGGKAADKALTAVESRLSKSRRKAGKGVEQMRGHVWVTRQDVYVDRIASAWLIRRFIDPKARFKFTAAKSYRPTAGEVRFDMFEAEYTHEGDRCTFEMLLERAGLRDRALRAIGEIVHDIDCKDAKFNREEAAGIVAILRGLVRSQADDETRLARGAEVFDQLYTSLR